MSSKQELTQVAGRKVAAVVKSLNERGFDSTPTRVLQEASEATDAATAAGATAKEIRDAGGLPSAANIGRPWR